jgi:transposase-like protein
MAKRRNFTPQDKVAILRRHLVENVPVSDLSDEYGLHPNQIYQWQKQFFERGAAAFEKPATRPSRASDTKIEKLEAKIREKNDVLAELMSEHVALKKELGEP